MCMNLQHYGSISRTGSLVLIGKYRSTKFLYIRFSYHEEHNGPVEECSTSDQGVPVLSLTGGPVLCP